MRLRCELKKTCGGKARRLHENPNKSSGRRDLTLDNYDLDESTQTVVLWLRFAGTCVQLVLSRVNTLSVPLLRLR